MDKTLQRVITLAREGNIERRCAALLVLGALEIENPEVVGAVGTALEHPNSLLKDYALRYIEECHPKTSLPFLLPLLDNEDREVSARVARVLVKFGHAAVRPLLQRLKGASRPWLTSAARVLCALRGKAAWHGLMQILAQNDPEVNKSVCDIVATTFRELDEKEQEVLYAEVSAFATALDTREQRPTLIAVIRLLGILGRPQARKWLIGFVGAEQPHLVRFHALVALLHCLRGQELLKGEVTTLLPLLGEKEFTDTVRLTLDLLDAHDLTVEYQPVLTWLLQSPHVAVQKFALKKMGEFDSPVVVKTLIQELDDADAARREAAARSLRKIPTARTALTKELLACQEPRKAWAIAEILPTYDGKWRRDTLAGAWQRLQTAIETEDRIQGAFLHFFRNVDADYVYGQCAARGTQLKNAKKYKEALRFLALLREFPTWTPNDKFTLAIAQLKLQPHDLNSVTTRHDPSLDVLVDLARSSTFPMLESLKKERFLEPEDLFYVGFRFAEGSAEVRDLGEELLAFLAERHGRTKVGKGAKNKLKLLRG
ncbi:MAG: HEAT repeat domain-containing protein [Candidatus Binatia bacterium]